MSADDNARVDAIEQALLARWPETRISPTLDRIAALTDILHSLRIQRFTSVEQMERPQLLG